LIRSGVFAATNCEELEISNLSFTYSVNHAVTVWNVPIFKNIMVQVQSALLEESLAAGSSCKRLIHSESDSLINLNMMDEFV